MKIAKTNPFYLDLNGDGFQFGGPAQGVWFDLLANGKPAYLQWVAGYDDAFLALDLNENGIVDDGSELFGSGTRMHLRNHRNALNGFIALAQYNHPNPMPLNQAPKNKLN